MLCCGDSYKSMGMWFTKWQASQNEIPPNPYCSQQHQNSLDKVFKFKVIVYFAHLSKKTRTNGLAETYKKFFECSQTKEISRGCSKPDHDIVSFTPY